MLKLVVVPRGSTAILTSDVVSSSKLEQIGSGLDVDATASVVVVMVVILWF